MIDMIIAIPKEGRINGKVIYQEDCSQLAPSILADSLSSIGIAWMALTKSSIVKPTHIQTPEKAIENMDCGTAPRKLSGSETIFSFIRMKFPNP